MSVQQTTKSQRQTNQERNIEALHQQHGDVTAGHRKCAVGKVDEIHQPHGHGQSDGKNKQQHAVGNAVKENGEHEK